MQACRLVVKYDVLAKPMRIKVIGWLMRAAYWLARPSINGTKFGQHFEIIVDAKFSIVNKSTRCHRMDQGILVVHGFEVFCLKTPQQEAIDKLIDDLEEGVNT